MVPAAVSSLNLVSNPEGVYAVFVNVYHGDITKDYSNIIVNGCNSRFELNSGKPVFCFGFVHCHEFAYNKKHA